MHKEYARNAFVKLSDRLEAIETVAEILAGQVKRQRHELAMLAGFCEIDNYRRTAIQAPSLDEMLNGKR